MRIGGISLCRSYDRGKTFFENKKAQEIDAKGSKMQILICDDEQEQIEKNTRLLEKALDACEVSGEFIKCTSLDQLFFQMEERGATIELILLDIYLSDEMNGIEVAKRLRDKYQYQGDILFVTKTEKYAIDAFDVRAFHYIVKSKTSESKKLSILTDAIKRVGKKKQKNLLLKGAGEFRNIPIDSIQYFEAMGYLVAVHYGKSEEFEFVSTFEKLSNTVLAFGIIRIHRSYLVNISQIHSFSYKGVQLKNGTVLPVGRKYLPDLKEVFRTERLD